MAISIRREKVPEELGDFYKLPSGSAQPKHLYRVIFRTCEVSRGSRSRCRV